MSNDKTKIKQKDKIIDTSIDEDDIPFKLCYYCKLIIAHEIVEVTDLELPLFNEFLYKVQKCPNAQALAKVISYNIRNIKRTGWYDQNRFPITSKYQYFKTCIIKGLTTQGIDQTFIDSLSNNYSNDALPF